MSKYIFTRKDKKNGSVKDCGYMQYDSLGEDSAELYFYGDICGATWTSEWFEEDKAPQDVVDFINEITSDGNKHKKLDIFVNSGGGDVYGGIAIYNILSRYEGEKIAHIDGIAASIAGIIPFACDKVVAKSSAQIMLHKPWTYCCGNADDMKKCIESLNTCEQSIVSIYADHAKEGVTAEKIKSMIDRETWLTCKQAAEYFNIEIEQGESVTACISDSFGEYKNTPENLKHKPTDKNEEKFNQKRKLQLMHDCMSMRLF